MPLTRPRRCSPWRPPSCHCSRTRCSEPAPARPCECWYPCSARCSSCWRCAPCRSAGAGPWSRPCRSGCWRRSRGDGPCPRRRWSQSGLLECPWTNYITCMLAGMFAAVFLIWCLTVSAKGRRAYVVVEVGVRDGDEVCCVRQIDQTVVCVFADCLVAGEVAVVDPDVGWQLDGDGVAVVREDLGDLHVPDDHILLAIDREADAGQGWNMSAYVSTHNWGPQAWRRMIDGHTATSLADDGLVARDLDLGRTTDGTLHDDHARSLGNSCSGELRQRANGSRWSASSTLCAIQVHQYATFPTACVYLLVCARAYPPFCVA